MYFLPAASFLGDFLSWSSIIESGLQLVNGLPPRATILASPVLSYEEAKAFFHKNWGVVTTRSEADSAFIVNTINFLYLWILYLPYPFWVISTSGQQLF